MTGKKNTDSCLDGIIHSYDAIVAFIPSCRPVDFIPTCGIPCNQGSFQKDRRHDLRWERARSGKALVVRLVASGSSVVLTRARATSCVCFSEIV